jgi:transposase
MVKFDDSDVKARLLRLWPQLNERSRRLTAATEAVQIGFGGITHVSRICGLSRMTIMRGIRELKTKPLPADRIRRPGGGRSNIQKRDPEIIKMIERLIDPSTRGDPESPIRWTCKSTRAIARIMKARKHPVSYVSIANLLKRMGFSLQSNRKTEEGNDHKDRDKQFRHINEQVTSMMKNGQPVVSVDTKKKELVGNYANSGKNWRPTKSPKKVQGHDFPKPEVPRAYPYGIYDIKKNRGFVNVGTDHDIDQFICSAIQHLNQIPLIRSLSLAIDFNFFPVRFINSSFVFA